MSIRALIIAVITAFGSSCDDGVRQFQGLQLEIFDIVPGKTKLNEVRSIISSRGGKLECKIFVGSVMCSSYENVSLAGYRVYSTDIFLMEEVQSVDGNEIIGNVTFTFDAKQADYDRIVSRFEKKFGPPHQSGKSGVSWRGSNTTLDIASDDTSIVIFLRVEKPDTFEDI